MSELRLLLSFEWIRNDDCFGWTLDGSLPRQNSKFKRESQIVSWSDTS